MHVESQLLLAPATMEIFHGPVHTSLISVWKSHEQEVLEVATLHPLMNSCTA